METGRAAQTRGALRVVVFNQVGRAAGGGERTLAITLRHAPSDVRASAIVLEDGAFADELRGLGVGVHVARTTPAIASATRERFRASAALEAVQVAREVAAIVIRERADVLYTTSTKAHVVGAVAGRLARTRCVMHFHDLLPRPGIDVVRAAARAGSAARIACSHAVARAFGLPKTTTVYAPVEMAEAKDGAASGGAATLAARAALGLPQHAPIVAIVGRINRWKGHDRFLRIAARVIASRPEVRFAIVGAPLFRDADFLPELHDQARALGIDTSVTFVPWVDDMRLVYEAIDVNVNCSTNEPLGRTPPEAAVYGVPSVVFSDSGIAETLSDSDAGRIVPAHDESLFAAAVVDLLDTSEASALAARAYASRFEASAVARQTFDILRSVAPVRS